eukprot:TRINITY_DN19002_c0_g1_i1.p1 TRINITY_DN19002_c0_g1~~TRINITY_DN19002_c0_g1_i1.p1  ORF type:complete len:1600 (+),score=403.82 TRINITY_DN19002_c0_g1_i1:44-4801(+)
MCIRDSINAEYGIQAVGHMAQPGVEGSSGEDHPPISPARSRWDALQKGVEYAQDRVHVKFQVKGPEHLETYETPGDLTVNGLQQQHQVKVDGTVDLYSMDPERLDKMAEMVLFKLTSVCKELDSGVVANMMEAKKWNSPDTQKITRKITDALRDSTKILEGFSIDLDGEDLPSADQMLEFGQEEFLSAMRKHFNALDTSADIMYEDVRYVVPVLPDGGIDTVCGRLVQMACGLCTGMWSTVQNALGNRNVHQEFQHVLGSRAHGLTGYIEGGSSTLLLGPPGSSKTSFLQMLAGQLHNKEGFDGTVSYEGLEGDERKGGVEISNLNTQRWATFVSQKDEHQTIMTVKETLDFAFACTHTGGGDRKSQAFKATLPTEQQDTMDKWHKLEEQVVELYLRLLMIYKCKDTIIGTQDGLLKGCSGGERRRVTLGEMLVTGGLIWLCDEISTGLDSNSTKEICIYIRTVASTFQLSAVVALLQPAPDVIELFKDVIVLAEGKVLYHGPVGVDGSGTAAVKSYFEDIGFVCPAQKDIGDFLQDVVTTSGLKLLKTDNTGRAPDRWTATNQQVANWLAGEWLRSELYSNQLDHVRKYHCKQDHCPELYSRRFDDRPMPCWMDSMKLVLAKACTVRMRNMPALMGRVIQNIFMGLIFGSLFFMVSDSQWYLKAMLFSQMLSFMQSSSIGQITQMVADRAIFYKQHKQGFYTGTQFALAELLSGLPFMFFDGLIFGNILYWMCGMVQEFVPWLLYTAIAIMYAIVMNMQISVFVYSQPTQSRAFVMAVLFILLWMMFGGAIATPNVIPMWLKWIYWINPQAWAYQALAINEFRTSKYDANSKMPGTNLPACFYNQQYVEGRCGDLYLRSRQFETDDIYLWGAFAVMGGWFLFLFATNMYFVNNVEFETPKAARPDEQDNHSQGKESADNDPNPIASQEEGIKAPFLLRSESTTLDLQGLCLECEPTTLCFDKMSYSVVNNNSEIDSEYYILNDVTGIARPGRMMALMGASGAGKTTLLDVLAGRKTTGTIFGDIAVNGKQIEPSQFAQSVGYVEQFGVHNTTATVMEALNFSAKLRNGEDVMREQFTSEIASMLELDLIGDKLVLHCSIEENKRLTIGVEAVANPSIIFLDEPTSGLDARSAMIVMRGIERIARTGRTVLATIHQPNIDIFNMFDGLLLLGKRPTGGFTAFFAEEMHTSDDERDCSVIIDYFWAEIHQGYVHKLPSNYNTATWMLEVIEKPGIDGKVQDWPGHWMSEKNQLYLAGEATAAGLLSGEREMAQPKKPYQAPARVQFGELLRRCATQYWRSPDFSFSRFMVIFFVSALVALIFQQQDYKEVADIQSRVSVIAFCVMLGGIYNLYTVIPFATENRAVFYRERSCGMYGNTAYVFSSWVELPYLVLETAIGVNTMYWLIGFRSEVDIWFFYNVVYFLYITSMTYMGMVLSALMPDVMGSQIIAALFLNVCSLFAGTIVPEENIPNYYKFLYWMSPQKWAQEAVIATQFHGDHKIICNPIGDPCPTPKHAVVPPGKLGTCCLAGRVSGYQQYSSSYTLDEFVAGYKYETRYYDLLTLFCWVLAARFLLGLIIHKVNHLKR